MLANLTIQDIVLIERLGIDLGAGLTILTGETGAGKSILLDALALALGGRGDGSLVRAGAERGQVTAVFEPPGGHPVRRLLADNGLETDGPVILRRTQHADGRTRAFVNDQPCGVALLRAAGTSLVEIHGQHDERALLDGAAHLRLLDAFAGLGGEAEEVRGRHDQWKAAEREAARLAAATAAAASEADYLRAAAAELEALAPEPGEEARLAERRQALMRAEKVAGDLGEAYELIGGSVSPVPDLSGLLRRLERKGAEAPQLLEPAIQALAGALDRLEEARQALEEAVREAAFDPGELEAAEERLFALRAAARKHRVAVDDLPALAAELAARLADIDHGEARLAAAEKTVAAARARYFEAAELLSERRMAGARALEAAVNAELPALRLEAASFMAQVHRAPGSAGPQGLDCVAFQVRTNPGTPAGPLAKVASGGELARFLLALKVALADRGSAPTLVFDEIDTGAGGAVAEAIGVRLARLAERVQVVAVTHAPQVAARAGAHLRITKAARDEGRTVATSVAAVSGRERREEIARMLAGARISEEARAAAERLIGEAV